VACFTWFFGLDSSVRRQESRQRETEGALARLTSGWAEYELVDSGDGRKLARFGKLGLVRPEAQAKWGAALPAARWDAADGEFVKPGTDGGSGNSGARSRHTPSSRQMYLAGAKARWLQGGVTRDAIVIFSDLGTPTRDTIAALAGNSFIQMRNVRLRSAASSFYGRRNRHRVF
jgi:hypothetical protein